MKKEIFLVTLLSLLTTTCMTALSDTYTQNAITVKQGPVKVKQGNNVTLWCQLKDGSQNGLSLPVHWQSPPNFRTRTSNCYTFGPSSVKQKYVMSCAERWYNMTITDVQLADQGQYRCIHTKHMSIVDLQVFGPCEKVLCHPGRVCQTTSKSTGACVCGPPDLCNDHHKQVCGDDGILYSSHCELHRTACIKDKHIGIDHTNNTCKPKVTNNRPHLVKALDGTVAFSGDVSVVIASIAVITMLSLSFPVCLMYP